MSHAAQVRCDSAGAQTDAHGAISSDHPNLVLITTILASSLAFVDGSVVNVALPAIGRNLHGTASDLQWLVNGYLLPLSAFLLLGGALGDRFGRRRLLVIGTALFAVASTACALAPTLGLLLAARVGQGAGAALLMPNSLAILGGTFSGAARGRAIGTWAAVGSMTSAVGPVLGGVLIDSTGWRGIFLLNLPLAAGAIGLALLYVSQGLAHERSKALDFAGAGVATLALSGLIWGLTVGSGPQGWTIPSLGAVLIGLGLLAVFVVLEKRLGDKAMTPLALFDSMSFVGLSLLTLLLYGALGGLLILLPYLLIKGLGYSATLAGAALLPFPLVLTVCSPIMGAIAGRIGPRWPLTIGPLVVAAGFLMLLRVQAASGYWSSIFPAMVVISLGMAGAVAPLTTAVLTSVDAQHTGSASGLNSALARAGGLIATASLGAVLAAEGSLLIRGFHLAVCMMSMSAALAGLCALLLIPNPKHPDGAKSV